MVSSVLSERLSAVESFPCRPRLYLSRTTSVAFSSCNCSHTHRFSLKPRSSDVLPSLSALARSFAASPRTALPRVVESPPSVQSQLLKSLLHLRLLYPHPFKKFCLLGLSLQHFLEVIVAARCRRACPRGGFDSGWSCICSSVGARASGRSRLEGDLKSLFFCSSILGAVFSFSKAFSRSSLASFQWPRFSVTRRCWHFKTVFPPGVLIGAEAVPADLLGLSSWRRSSSRCDHNNSVSRAHRSSARVATLLTPAENQPLVPSTDSHCSQD